ncbi:MAG: carboxypeptidase regulatory-like domain-containing protein [Thermoplasmata archaeon]
MRVQFVLLLLFLLFLNLHQGSPSLAVAESRTTVLTGYVYDVIGNGIKDATVSALEYTTGTEYTTTTDANGLFQFMNVEPGKMYYIRVSALGYYHRSKHDCVAGNSYTFVLERSGGVVGKVWGSGGEAVKNATLVLSNPKFNVELCAISDESGAFRFTSSDFEKQLYPGSGYEIHASATGYLSSILAENLSVSKGTDTFVNLTLPNSGIISGTVRGNTGERVRDARVYAFDKDGYPVCMDLTDEDGEYVLNTELAPGTYKVQVFPQENSTGSWLNSGALNVSIAVPGGVVNNVDFILEPAGILRGNVTDENGPLADAMVTLSNDEGMFAFGVTDTSGFFSISSPSLRTGTYTVRAEAPHHIWEEKTVQITAGEISWVDLNLQKSRSVSGYLRTVSGQPLLGSVEIFDAGGRSIEKLYTSQEGFYKLDTNLVSGIYRVESRAPGCIPVSREVDLTTILEVENFNFTLREAGRAVVNLTDYAGGRIAGAMGYLVQKSGESYTICESRSSSADGTLVFGDGWQNLAEGTYSLLLRNAPGCEERFFENLISIHQGTTNFYAVSLNKSAEVYGHAYYRKTTEPVEDVHIEFIRSFPFTTSTGIWTDSEGYFHIVTSLSCEEYHVAARHYYYGSAELSVCLSSVEKTEVNIFFGTSSGTGGISGIVKEKWGSELSGVLVSVYNGTKKIKSGLTNETGYFFITEVPEGLYRLTFAKEGYVTLQLENVTVVADENTDIGIVELEKYIPPPGNITGYVMDPDGNPIPGATVTVEGTEISVISNSMGEFQITGLKEGVYFLLVSSAGYKDKREIVSVTSGNTTTVWIHLDKEEPVNTTPSFTVIQAISVIAAILFGAKIKRR